MKYFSSKVFLTVTLLAVSCSLHSPFVSDAFAQDIIIQDTSGTERAQGSLDGATDGNVTMTVTDTATGLPPADGTTVVLTPTAGGAAITGTVVNGEVVFTGLSGGTYTVASSSALTFTSITITSAAAVGGAAITGGAIAAGAAGVGVVGGATAIAINASDDNDNDEDPLSPIR